MEERREAYIVEDAVSGVRKLVHLKKNGAMIAMVNAENEERAQQISESWKNGTYQLLEG